ncbi:hypothetical protein [Streptomyces sp. MUM 178J]|uniref:hypothetical protein n=1 Tax=Streptomyces sp. MUM 178J TaxID=2791991 RepID=UPI001F043E6D|nr:hypothetical protein [Streptomyces sp. MUM 178J]WRQ81772.1 hypothetical protein I3F59_021780 [Streptomyces sp. MUM 178J]
MASKSLTELIAQADERGLAASGLACLDRCLPLLALDDEGGEPLRPLWAGVAEGEETWGARLAEVRAALDGVDARDDEAVSVRRMLGAAPAVWAGEPLREWADGCSAAALRIHRGLDGVDPAADADWLAGCRTSAEGAGADGLGPLVLGELRRQQQILETLERTPGTGALRRVLDLSAEGRRVLTAAASRRARVRD